MIQFHIKNVLYDQIAVQISILFSFDLDGVDTQLIYPLDLVLGGHVDHVDHNKFKNIM